MLYTLQTVKDNIRNRDGKRVFYLGEGDQLTASARDYLSGQKIKVLSAKEAKPEYFELLNGGYVTEKPEHMTHLHGNILVDKTHPRIAFRGAMDTLQAEILLCLQEAQGDTRRDLEEILAFSGKLLSWEVMDEPVQMETLCGLTQQQLRSHSHRPQDFYGQAHFKPTGEDTHLLLLLNRARCAARSAELNAAAAFRTIEGKVTRADILQAMNRLSSMLYILMIREKAK